MAFLSSFLSSFKRPNHSKWMSQILGLCLALVLTFHSPSTFAQKGSAKPSGALQAFMLTTTYGVIAGTLTGLASLAFYEEPSTKTRNVAVGASLGLYIGILLGAYVVYSPAMSEPSKSGPGRDIRDEYDDDPIDLGVKQSLQPYLAHMSQNSNTWQAMPMMGITENGNTTLGVKFNF